MLDPAAPPWLSWALVALAVPLLVRAIGRLDVRESLRPLRAALLALVGLAAGTFLLSADGRPWALAFVAYVLSVSGALLPEGPTRRLAEALGKARLATFCLSVATLAGLAFVHLPLLRFLPTTGEASSHAGGLLETNVPRTMVAVLLAALLYGFLPSPRSRTLLAAASLAAVPVALVYAFVYPFGYPPTRGLSFEQLPVDTPTLAGRALVDALTVGVVAAASVAAARRLRGGRVVACLLVGNAVLAVASWRVVERDRERVGTAAGYPLQERPLRFTKNGKNVLVVVLDRFMGGFLERILEDEPSLREALDGFTWYPRTVAAGENSLAGVPPLLGGYDYLPHETNRRGRLLRDVTAEAFSILPLNFSARGWQASLVNPRGLGLTAEGDCSVLRVERLECTRLPLSVPLRLAREHGVAPRALADAGYAAELHLLGLMRIAPYVLRDAVQRRAPWRGLLDHSPATTFREWAEIVSWPALTRTDAGRESLNVVFSLLPHEPYFLGDDCLPRARRFVPADDEIRRLGLGGLFEYQHYVATRCTLSLAARYFTWLREQGVWRDTTVVVASDHGIVGPVEDRSSRAVAGGTQSELFVRTRSLLLVKPARATGPLRVSEEFLPGAEVPRIVCEVIGGCTNPYLGGAPVESRGRDLPFRVAFVPWQAAAQGRTAYRVTREISLVAPDPYDRRAWRTVAGAGPGRP